MGILDQADDPPPLCKFGQILTGAIGNSGGDTLEADDVDYLVAMRARPTPRGHKHGASWFATTLRSAGLSCSTSVMQLHFGGSCACPDDVPLKNT